MKELDDNLLNSLFWSIMQSRKEPKETNKEPEMPEDLKLLENKKRARYEALKEKYKD